MSIQELQTLFLRDLADIYASEQHTLPLLETIAGVSTNQEVRATILYHVEETRQHATLLGQVFKVLGTKPEPADCLAVNALQADYEALLAGMHLSPVMQTMAGLDVVGRLEHLEMISYQGLVRKALLLGENDSAQRLVGILHQEEQMARSVSDLGNALGRELIEQVTA